MKRFLTAVFVLTAFVPILMSGCSGSAPTEQPAEGGDTSSQRISAIAEEDAQKIALDDSGANGSDVENIRTELDLDDGVLKYEVSFFIGGVEFVYDIAAENGAILNKSVDINDAGEAAAVTVVTSEKSSENTSVSNRENILDETISTETTAPTNKSDTQGSVLSQPSSAENKPAAETAGRSVVSAAEKITENEAKKIALDDAGVSESDVRLLTVKSDWDDGVLEYDVEFYVGTTEYDYEINAHSGAISCKDIDYHREHSGNHHSAGAAAGADITPEAAKKIALDKISGASDGDIVEFKLDNDGGRLIYEGEIIYKEIEYEFEIDANTGKILEWESESIYD